MNLNEFKELYKKYAGKKRAYTVTTDRDLDSLVANAITFGKEKKLSVVDLNWVNVAKTAEHKNIFYFSFGGKTGGVQLDVRDWSFNDFDSLNDVFSQFDPYRNPVLYRFDDIVDKLNLSKRRDLTGVFNGVRLDREHHLVLSSAEIVRSMFESATIEAPLTVSAPKAVDLSHMFYQARIDAPVKVTDTHLASDIESMFNTLTTRRPPINQIEVISSLNSEKKHKLLKQLPDLVDEVNKQLPELEKQGYGIETDENSRPVIMYMAEEVNRTEDLPPILDKLRTVSHIFNNKALKMKGGKLEFIPPKNPDKFIMQTVKAFQFSNTIDTKPKLYFVYNLSNAVQGKELLFAPSDTELTSKMLNERDMPVYVSRAIVNSPKLLRQVSKALCK